MKERIKILLAGGALAIGLLLLVSYWLRPQQIVRPVIIKHTVERRDVCAPPVPEGRIQPPFEKNL